MADTNIYMADSFLTMIEMEEVESCVYHVYFWRTICTLSYLCISQIFTKVLLCL